MVNAGEIEKSAVDSYKFVKMVGKGSYGQVWLATRASDGTQVAIKVYYGGDKKIIENMEEELKALTEISRVCSQYAVCILDSYYSGGAPRIVMEFVHGAPLSKYMRGIPLDQRQGRNDIIQNLLYGLQALHAAGATHQDIKEDNIMWDERIQMPRYVDWGLACLKQYCDRLPCEEPCGVSGTAYTAPPYMTIGEFNEQNFDMAKAHDIWSIGVVLMDWFLMPPDMNVCMLFYEPDCRELSAGAPRNQSPQQIQQAIDYIGNPLAKQVLPLLLAHTWEERVNNWPTVTGIVTGSIVAVMHELFTPLQYNTLLDNFTNNAKLLASLQPGSYYLRLSIQTPGITLVMNDPERGILRFGFLLNLVEPSLLYMGKLWKKWYEGVQYILSGKDYTEISPIPLSEEQKRKEMEKEAHQQAMATFREQRRQAAVEREARRRQVLQKAFMKNPTKQLKDIIAIPAATPDTFWCFTKDDIIRNKSFDPTPGTFTNPYTGKPLKLSKSDKEAVINYMMRSALV